MVVMTESTATLGDLSESDKSLSGPLSGSPGLTKTRPWAEVTPLRGSPEFEAPLIPSPQDPVRLPLKNDPAGLSKRVKKRQKAIRQAYERRWASIVTGQCIYSQALAKSPPSKKRHREGGEAGPVTPVRHSSQSVSGGAGPVVKSEEREDV